MMKCCAINLKCKCICIDIILSKIVADDLLQYDETEKWYLLKSTGRKRLVNGSYCSKFQSGKRASVKQLFTNYLGLRINSFTNLQLWRNWHEKRKKKKKMCCSNVGIEKFKKLTSLEKNI